MAGVTFQFDQVKATEAILYLADKTSLEKYGRFIFGESYYAMKEGPTPSYTYNLLKQAAERPTPALKVEGYKVTWRY